MVPEPNGGGTMTQQVSARISTNTPEKNDTNHGANADAHHSSSTNNDTSSKAPLNGIDSSSAVSTTTITTSARVLGVTFRCLLLDLPVLALAMMLVSLFITQYAYDKYFIPQVELMKWTSDRKRPETTYYNRECNVDDISTNDTIDLIISPSTTPKEAMHHMARHGVSVYPHVISDQLADDLHAYIVERNHVEDNFWVIEGYRRYTWGVNANQHPLVAAALQEIYDHPTFRPAIEQICGPNPAVIEFTAITSEYGAKDQFWHQDTLPRGSSFKYAHSFIPSYSLFIPLQDTSAKLGATEICPATHVCDGSVEDACMEYGFSVAGSNDVWSKGAGALVNQHLFHRGTAHRVKGGTERVLFIVTFAPRPRFDKLETRLLSMGGSYSLHWSQWGHTLEDFGHAPTRMTEPWKTLRSLGLYKPSKSQWGWDMLSVASMRIANYDNGYAEGSLEEWLDKGGFKWLPNFLQVDAPEFDGWFDYLQKLLDRSKEVATAAYLTAVAVYLVFFLSIDILLGKEKGGGIGRSSSLVRGFRRLLIIHACVALVGWRVVTHVDHTPWARNIVTAKQYRPQTEPSQSGLPVDMVPGTLPFHLDVLVETKYDSEHLYGYNYILEDAHPGNREYKRILTNYSKGYAALSPNLQVQLCEEIVEWVGRSRGRFLTPNEEGNWSQLSFAKAAKDVHKDLMKHDNPVLYHVLTQLAYLVSETKFGAFRDMAIHRKHIPDLLHSLQDKMLNPPFDSLESNKTVMTTQSSRSDRSSNGFGVKLAPLKIPKAPVDSGGNDRPYAPMLPPLQAIREPYLGAWMNEGDVVEGRYKGKHNEWYKGVIDSVDANKGTYHVLYDDDELDKNLCRVCVRPYKSLKEDELVQVRTEDDIYTYYQGHITFVHPDGTVDVDTEKGGKFKQVPPFLVRRFDPELGKKRDVDGFTVGNRVEALYQGEWYPGVVMAVSDDGNYHVAFDDGDEDTNVPQQDVRRGFTVGNRVEALYQGEGEWSSGVVMAIFDDGTYHVAFDDGDEDTEVDPKNIRSAAN